MNAVDKDKSDGVILCMMKVTDVKRRNHASVFWDSGRTSNFVREAQAELCGFKGKKEELSVTTLGGEITDYSVTTYSCLIQDKEGKSHRFEAYGMECITGPLKTIDLGKLKKIIPSPERRRDF